MSAKTRGQEAFSHKKETEKLPLLPLGLTAHNLSLLDVPKREALVGNNTKQNFIQSFLNQVDVNNDRVKM